MAPEGPPDNDADNRRAQLQRWIDEHFGSVRARFVEAIEINQGELSGLLHRKSFGEKRARRLEEQANMPHKYLERRPGSPLSTLQIDELRTIVEAPWPFKKITPDQYRSLTADQKQHVENTISLLMPARMKESEGRNASGQ